MAVERAPGGTSLIDVLDRVPDKVSWSTQMSVQLKVRTRTLNRELAATFRAWYPDFALDDHPIPAEELPAAA